MASLNKTLLIGRLGKDPEIRSTGTGTTVATITIATDEKYKDSSGQWQERTEWHRVVAFGPKGETMGKYLRKGSSVFIEGKLQTRSWDDKDGSKRYSTEIIVVDFQFLDSNGERSEPEQQYRSAANATVEDEDIPF